jgi:hypothetical protein
MSFGRRQAYETLHDTRLTVSGDFYAGADVHPRKVKLQISSFGRHSVQPRSPGRTAQSAPSTCPRVIQGHRSVPEFLVPRLKLWVAQGIIGSHERRWWAATT